MTRGLHFARIICNIVVGLIVIAGLITPAVSQQPYVSRYDAFIGYSYFDSPKISLAEHGFHFQIGMRPRTWYSLGFDYSQVKGDLMLTPELLPDATRQALTATLQGLAAAGQLPAGYTLAVKANSRTHTFAAGPQLAYRRWKSVTPFLRPSLGAIYEVADPAPADPIAKAIVARLSPEGRKTDWQGFYGVGGGIDLNASRHVVLRFQADWVYDHLFDDILKDGRGTVRFSVGPAFNFGRNIKE